MKYILVPILTILLLSACSTKKYFEPKKVSDVFEAKETTNFSSIKSMNRFGATLENGKIITYDGISKFKLPKGFEFLSVSNSGKILATNYKDTLMVGNEKLTFKDIIIAASLKDDKLALVYSNNTIELLDFNTKKTLYKEHLSISLANDTRIVNPYFMGSLVLFPTLNGKVIIVSTKTNESIKTISVDPNGQFNNIIFLSVIKKNQTLILASPNKLVTVSSKTITSKDYELRDVLVHDEDVYIATIDGQIIKLNSQLEELTKEKFRYSKIHALAFSNDYLYAIESQGYIIKIDSDFIKSKVYKFKFDNEKKMIAIGNKIYLDERTITLP